MSILASETVQDIDGRYLVKTDYSDGSVDYRHPTTMKLHRKGGPAFLHNGVEKWYKNGRLHRVGGPAERCLQYEAYYQKGYLHNTRGPAIKWENGESEYHVNGVRFSYVAFSLRQHPSVSKCWDILRYKEAYEPENKERIKRAFRRNGFKPDEIDKIVDRAEELASLL